MKIEDCYIGMIVKVHGERIGHICGLHFNASGEVIPMIQFPSVNDGTDYARGLKYPVHHGNLDPLSHPEYGATGPDQSRDTE